MVDRKLNTLIKWAKNNALNAEALYYSSPSVKHLVNVIKHWKTHNRLVEQKEKLKCKLQTK